MTVAIDLVARVGHAMPRARGWAACLVLALLAGCGGGGREQKFVPTSLTVFGDEVSTIRTADGARYTVNPLKTDNISIDCTTNTIWVQQLASNFGFGFSQCPLASDPASRARIYAEPGTGAAQIAAQITQAISDRGPFGPTDLVTIYTGQNDVINLYTSLSPSPADCSFAEGQASSAGPVARQAINLGAQVAAQINRVAPDRAGGRVIFVTVPDVGRTPYGRAQADGGSCLTQLALAFNSGLRTNVIQDGRLSGLVLLDDRVNSALKGFLGFVDVVTPICTAALPDCTTSSLISGLTTSNYLGYLWADDRHFGPAMQTQFGALAVQRATNNPF